VPSGRLVADSGDVPAAAADDSRRPIPLYSLSPLEPRTTCVAALRGDRDESGALAPAAAGAARERDGSPLDGDARDESHLFEQEVRPELDPHRVRRDELSLR
jgi:hypothetical protein